MIWETYLASDPGSAAFGWREILLVALGYLVGSIPFGFLAGKSRGVDIRQHGSGNIGATNVLRTLGKPLGITVFILDVLKGALPVALALWLTPSSLTHVAVALATILGHNYTCWLGFKGGKGIATSAGVLMLLFPIPLLLAIATWLVLFFPFRYVSVGSIGAALCIPISECLLSWRSGEWRWPLVIFSIVISILAIWRHRSNIRKLIDGTENRFEPKKKRKDQTPPDSQTGPES